MIIIMIFMVRGTLTILLKLQTKYVLFHCCAVLCMYTFERAQKLGDIHSVALFHLAAPRHVHANWRACHAAAGYVSRPQYLALDPFYQAPLIVHFIFSSRCWPARCVRIVLFRFVSFRSVSCVPMYLLIPFTSVSHNLHEPKIQNLLLLQHALSLSLLPLLCRCFFLEREHIQPFNVLTFMKFMLFYFVYWSDHNFISFFLDFYSCLLYVHYCVLVPTSSVSACTHHSPCRSARTWTSSFFLSSSFIETALNS